MVRLAPKQKRNGRNMDVKEWIPTILQLLLVVFSSAMIICDFI